MTLAAGLSAKYTHELDKAEINKMADETVANRHGVAIRYSAGLTTVWRISTINLITPDGENLK